MPYAAFHANLDVLEAPDADAIARAAAEAKQPGVVIFGYRFESLEPLAPFAGYLRTLKISGAPHLTSLEGIQALAGLEELVLATTTGSAGAGRRIGVESYRPLVGLTGLRRLILQEVRPDDLDLSPIVGMSGLEDLDIGGVPEFTVEHYAALAKAFPKASGRCLSPYVSIPGIGRCKKCDGRSVLLVGTPPRARAWVCPMCNAKLLAAHVAKWETVTGRSFIAPRGVPRGAEHP